MIELWILGVFVTTCLVWATTPWWPSHWHRLPLMYRPRIEEPHWREMDYKYLLAMNELNVEFPTYTEEEKSLARYLEFNNEEDHERRKEKTSTGVHVEGSGVVRGSFTTLVSPGLAGGLGILGGAASQQSLGRPSNKALGGLGALANAKRESDQLQQQGLEMLNEAHSALTSLRLANDQRARQAAFQHLIVEKNDIN